MQFKESSLPGAWHICLDRIEDERGWFARSYCTKEFLEAGIEFIPRQTSLACNRLAGTLRGLHWQAEPAGEFKLVRCLAGAVFDVLVDLRENSPTYRKYQSFTLSAVQFDAVFIPRGVAHGYLTLEDRTLLSYEMDTPYAPAHARGVRWNDPVFAIAWPCAPTVLSKRDAEFPDFKE